MNKEKSFSKMEADI